AKIANLDAGKISTGTLDAGRIAANSISTEKLLIGSTDNLVDDPRFETFGTSNSVWGSPTSTAVQDATGGRGGGSSLKVTLDGSEQTVTSAAQWRTVP